VSRATLTARVRERVLEHAAATYPYEGCGLLIGYVGEDGPRVTRALPCPNVAAPETRTHRFSIDPRAVLNVRKSLRGSQETVIGFFHSHPDAPAAPSVTDMEYIRLWPETVWLIVPVFAGDATQPRAWWLDDADEPQARELAVEVLPVRTAVMATCPE
jgi:proteasome lid subunit RPN8/RPN11